jgi:hypothetical protein
MVLDEMIEAVPLELIERAIVATVILYTVLKERFDQGFRLPGGLSVGEPSPFHEV